jgi:hypothetical protein
MPCGYTPIRIAGNIPTLATPDSIAQEIANRLLLSWSRSPCKAAHCDYGGLELIDYDAGSSANALMALSMIREHRGLHRIIQSTPMAKRLAL